MSEFEHGLIRDIALLLLGALITWAIEHIRDTRKEAKDRAVAKQLHGFSWEMVNDGAIALGKELFGDFKPQLILTFAGGGSIFCGLMNARTLDRKQLLSFRVITGQLLAKDSGVHPGTAADGTVLESERFHIYVPPLGAIGATTRVVVVDDTAITGSTMRAVKRHLLDLGCLPENVRCACFAALDSTRLLDPSPVDWACEWVQNVNFSLPWGRRV